MESAELQPLTVGAPRETVTHRVVANVIRMCAVCLTIGTIGLGCVVLGTMNSRVLWLDVDGGLIFLLLGSVVALTLTIVVFLPFSLIQIAEAELLPRTWGRWRRVSLAATPLAFPVATLAIHPDLAHFVLWWVWVWVVFALTMKLPPGHAGAGSNLSRTATASTPAVLP